MTTTYDPKRVARVYANRLRDNARTIKSLGDMVGANNMGLSNLLWRTSAETKAYAVEFEKAHGLTI
jgi:hypothetical protein